MPRKPNANCNSYELCKSVTIFDIEYVDLKESHLCSQWMSDKTKLLEYGKKALENINWEHQIVQRISDEIFLKALHEFGRTFIDKCGWPKSGDLKFSYFVLSYRQSL